jgi:hypothetical protein
LRLTAISVETREFAIVRRHREEMIGETRCGRQVEASQAHVFIDRDDDRDRPQNAIVSIAAQAS